MDSPTELSAQTIRTFKVRGGDGKDATIRVAIHHDASEAEVNEYVAGAEKIVSEQGAVFGEFPAFEPGHYTFLGDYVPWGGGDGMEHRNSTVVAAPVSLRMPGMVADVLDTVVARVLPRLERGAHPAEDARAVQFRRGQHLGRAVARRRVHAVLRHARSWGGPACRRVTRPRPGSRARRRRSSTARAGSFAPPWR